MMYIGIDPGKTGGWAAIDTHGHALSHTFSSFTEFQKTLFPETGPFFAVLEKVHASPGMGVSSSFTFGENFGGWKTTLELMNISYELVTPQTWQRNILGVIPTGKSKEVALSFVQKKWPEKSLKKSHSGQVDALCMALYAQRLHTQKVPLRT